MGSGCGLIGLGDFDVRGCSGTSSTLDLGGLSGIFLLLFSRI